MKRATKTMLWVAAGAGLLYWLTRKGGALSGLGKAAQHDLKAGARSSKHVPETKLVQNVMKDLHAGLKVLARTVSQAVKSCQKKCPGGGGRLSDAAKNALFEPVYAIFLAISEIDAAMDAPGAPWAAQNQAPYRFQVPQLGPLLANTYTAYQLPNTNPLPRFRVNYDDNESMRAPETLWANPWNPLVRKDPVVLQADGSAVRLSEYLRHWWSDGAALLAIKQAEAVLAKAIKTSIGGGLVPAVGPDTALGQLGAKLRDIQSRFPMGDCAECGQQAPSPAPSVPAISAPRSWQLCPDTVPAYAQRTQGGRPVVSWCRWSYTPGNTGTMVQCFGADVPIDAIDPERLSGYSYDMYFINWPDYTGGNVSAPAMSGSPILGIGRAGAG
jgi:hypothetical protein